LADKGWPGDGVVLVLDDLVFAEGALQLFELLRAVELLRSGFLSLALRIGAPRGGGSAGSTGGGSSRCGPGARALLVSVLTISALGRRLRSRSVLRRRLLRSLGALSLIRGDLCDQGRLLGGRLGVLLCRRVLIGDSRDFGGLFLRTLRRNLAAVDNRGASGSRVLGLGLLLLGLLLFSLLGRCLLGLIFCSLLGRSLFFGLLRRGLFLSFLLGSSFLCLLRLFGFCLLELFSLSLLGLLLSRLLRCSLLCGSFLGLLRFGLLGLFCLGLLSFSLFGSLG